MPEIPNQINHPIKYRYLQAEQIKPSDDAYHKSKNLFDVEWWYFDAVLENGLSLHIGLRTYHFRNSGLLQTRINVYKDGKTIKEKFQMHLFPDVFISSKEPKIQILGKDVVKFDQEHMKKTGIWKYTVILDIEDTSVDLIFTGTTQGWKIETTTTCWTTACPKATVQGNIIFNGEKLSVKGIGYHDHNWGYSASTAFSTIGWYWGRITGDLLNLTWAKTMINKNEGDLLSILNRDYSKKNHNQMFTSIHPDNIVFHSKNYVRKKGQMIPTEFKLQCTYKTEQKIPISIDINMKTIDVQHARIFIAHYWRYHVYTTGTLQWDSHIETLKEKPQIIEFLSFKSQAN
jgi:predicted secreted hydrolase